MMKAWTYEGYWATVLGANRSAQTVVEEFGLPRGGDLQTLSTWLGTAEVEAWRAGKIAGELPEEWAEFHKRAIDELSLVGVDA